MNFYVERNRHLRALEWSGKVAAVSLISSPNWALMRNSVGEKNSQRLSSKIANRLVSEHQYFNSLETSLQSRARALNLQCGWRRRRKKSERARIIGASSEKIGKKQFFEFIRFVLFEIFLFLFFRFRLCFLSLLPFYLSSEFFFFVDSEKS